MQGADGEERHGSQRRDHEAEEDGPARAAHAVHLGENVTQHVGQREQQRAAVGDQREQREPADGELRAELDQLDRGDVRDQQERAEQRDDEVVHARRAGGERGPGLGCHPAIVRECRRCLCIRRFSGRLLS
mgnify:CR=1 FL=1